MDARGGIGDDGRSTGTRRRAIVRRGGRIGRPVLLGLLLGMYAASGDAAASALEEPGVFMHADAPDDFETTLSILEPGAPAGSHRQRDITTAERGGPYLALSPDGTVAAYTCGEFMGAICTTEITTGVSREIWSLPDGLGRVTSLAFAPSGTELLVAGDDVQTQVDFVRRIRLDGSLLGTVQQSSLSGPFPVSAEWFPDQGSILLMTQEEEPDGTPRLDLQEIGSDGSVIRVVDPDVPGTVGSARISPNGQKLLLAVGGEFWISDADGSDAEFLVEEGEIAGLSEASIGGWLPAGQGFVMYRDVWNPDIGWRSSIYALPYDGTSFGTPELLVPTYLGRSQLVFRQPSTSVTREDYLAATHRPVLRFDEGEKWRPLNIDAFLNERLPNGDPYHLICNLSGCGPVEGLASLRSWYAGTDPNNPQVWLHMTWPHSPEKTLEPDWPLSISQPYDANDGPRSSIYYEATSWHGYTYLDYWWFYRHNEFPGFNHQGDWEGMTVAVSDAYTGTFDWVSFAQHAYRTAYLRDVLWCDGGDNPCSASGRRAWVFPANGTHASYPDSCTTVCLQPTLAPEGDHGGEVSWGRNEDAAASGALEEFPGPRGWADQSTANWTDWPGRWGGAADEPGTVESPGNQARYQCPSEGHSSVACTARRNRRILGATRSLEASQCRTWFGGSSTATLCYPRLLRRALDAGTLGRRGRMGVQARGRRVATAPGVAQVVGRPLKVGERLRLSGLPRRRGSLVLALRDRKRIVVARFARLQRGRSATVKIVRREGRVTALMRFAQGSSQLPSSLRRSRPRGR